MKSLIFTIMLAAFSVVTPGWADEPTQPPHIVSPYVGISGSDIGLVVPMIGIRTQCKDVILDFNASYYLIRGGYSDYHYATLSAAALSAFLRNDSVEFYGGLGVQVSGLFHHSRLKHSRRNFYPEFIAGVKRKISEDNFIFFQINVHPWEIPIHGHSTSERSGAVVFKMGISI